MDSKTLDKHTHSLFRPRLTRLIIVSCIAALTLPLGACATTVRVKPPAPTVTVRVGHAPPALKREVVTVRPSKRHVWVDGHWTWTRSRWVWAPGVWKVPPRGKRVWVKPKYERRGGHWVVVRGYWR